MVAFILGEYPSVTESFIRNEMVELRKRGMQIVIISVRKGDGADQEKQVIYDQSFFASSKIVAHFYHIFRNTGPYFLTLGRLLLSANLSPIQMGRNLKNFSKSIYFLFRLRKLGCLHLHAHFLSKPASVAMIMSAVSGLRFSCSAHAHDIYTTPISELKVKLKQSVFTVTCTYFNKKYLRNLVEHDKNLYHIYHGINFSKWPQKSFSALTSELRILSVGRLVEKKGIIYLLKAILALKQGGISVKCTIVGDGPLLATLNNFIVDHELENEINLMGALNAELTAQCYQTADIFVLPCIEVANGDKDGLPNVLLEALATGIPVVATPISAIPELVEHNQTGLLVPQKDHLGIAEAVVRLLEDKELYHRLVVNGRKKVEGFDINVSTGQLYNVFKNYVLG